jgi:hypothetical protein
MLYKGRCHCGKIAFEVDLDLQQQIECNCTHCSRKGYRLAFVPREKLRLLTPAADTTIYTFNTHKIRHRFCATCGCAPYADEPNSKGGETAAINLRCLDDVDLSKLPITYYDGRSQAGPTDV